MPKILLHLDSSLAGAASVSRRLTMEFVENWQKAHPDGVVLDRDLNAMSIPPVNGAWAGAIYTPEEARTADQRELLKLSDTLIGELEAADEYVIGVPMYNFSIPSTLKLWIDQVARVNKTFSYATGTPVGLLTGKKATIVIASGGKYDAGDRDGFVQSRGAVPADRAGLSGRAGCNVRAGRRSFGVAARRRPRARRSCSRLWSRSGHSFTPLKLCLPYWRRKAVGGTRLYQYGSE